MRHNSGLPMRWVRQMQETLFDLSPEGVLTYLDPMIGELQNRNRDLAVVVNSETNCLELVESDRVVQVFDLAERVQQACKEAFGAYFSAFERLCRTAGMNSRTPEFARQAA